LKRKQKLRCAARLRKGRKDRGVDWGLIVRVLVFQFAKMKAAEMKIRSLKANLAPQVASKGCVAHGFCARKMCVFVFCGVEW